MEIGPSEAIYADPKHPYTQALLRAIPEPDPRRTIPRDLPRGEVPDASRPPLGCSFHPRCPKAFEVCGWESRDLKELLERRWAGLDEEGFEAEQAAVGPMEDLDVAETHVRLAAHGGADGADLRGLLESAKASDPAEPFWTGVQEIRDANGSLEIDWYDPVEPRLLQSGSVEGRSPFADCVWG